MCRQVKPCFSSPAIKVDLPDPHGPTTPITGRLLGGSIAAKNLTEFFHVATPLIGSRTVMRRTLSPIFDENFNTNTLMSSAGRSSSKRIA